MKKREHKSSRLIKDKILATLTWIFSSFGILVLVAILSFIFSKGASTLSFSMIFGNYHPQIRNLYYEKENTMHFEEKEISNSYYSLSWGIALKDTKNHAGEDIIVVSYIEEKSPFRYIYDQTTNEIEAVQLHERITKIVLEDEEGNMYVGLAKNGAQKMVETMEKGTRITDLQVTTIGGGIKGSLLTTLLLIILSLVIALPFGIGGAIYLAEYARDNHFTHIIRTMVDMSNGIPSIIFGLVGAATFLPFMNHLGWSSSYSILAGACTMSLLLLPTIIKTVEESIRNIPSSYRSASYALGASQTQTIWKIILPNAMSGILTSTLLAIGRIIGESAALIYVMGTAIQDQVYINKGSTSLAVHIWSLMQGEHPNYAQACAISLLILIIVLVLNLVMKLIQKHLSRWEVK